MERHFFGGGNFYGFWDDIFGSRTPSEFCVASGCLSSLLGLGASSQPLRLGAFFWASSLAFSGPRASSGFCGLLNLFLGLGPLRASGTFFLGVFPAFSGPRTSSGLLWASEALSGVGPLRASSEFLGLFLAFSEPRGLFWAFSGFRGPFCGFFGPRASCGLFWASEPLPSLFWAWGPLLGLFEASGPLPGPLPSLFLAFFGLSGPGLFWAFCGLLLGFCGLLNLFLGLGPLQASSTLLGLFSAFSKPWGPRAFCGLFWASQPFLGLGAFSGPSKLLDSSRPLWGLFGPLLGF